MYAYIVFIRDGDINKQNLIYITNYTYQFEFIFLFLVSKFLYNTKYYKHQNISMIILVLIALIKFIFNFYETEIEKVAFLLLFYIIYSFFKTLLICYIKGLMEYKYFSIYKASYIFGMIDLIIVTIVYIIISFIPCETDYCKIEYNGKKYFGNIILIFTLYGLFMLFIFLTKAIFKILNYNIIN